MANQALDEIQAKKLADQFQIKFVRLNPQSVDKEVLKLLPEAIARSKKIVAYALEKGLSGAPTIHLAVANPEILEHQAPVEITDLHTKLGYTIEVSLTMQSDIDAALALYSNNVSTVAEKETVTSNYPVVDLVNRSIPLEVITRIPEETAKKYRVIVFEIDKDGKTLHVALEDPNNPQVQDLLGFIKTRSHLDMKLYQTSKSSIDVGLTLYHNDHKTTDVAAGIAPQPGMSDAASKIDVSKITIGNNPSANSTQTSMTKMENVLSQKMPIPDPPKVPAITKEQISTPDLRVPEQQASSLIPITGDVEGDLIALAGQKVESVEALESIAKTGFIPKIVAAVLLLAVEMRASDIHIQADNDFLLVRYRVDGILANIIKLPVALQAPIVSRIKILANLKIDEQRVPQDGRFDVRTGDKEIDLRVSTFPTISGEKVVIRLLDKSIGLLKLDQIGLAGSRLERLRSQIRKPFGVILATGPTGSGKSTTLYSVLQEIASSEVNVVTLEDPVEYEIPGINQAQIKPKIGFGFAEGLRAILRQDPNIIMVGEIRDLETASMVTHAALTGHLVLSTLHTNDAAGALPRMMNMGVEPFLLSSAINAIIGQRLVRRLCDKCREPWKAPQEVLDEVKQILSEGNLPELTDRLKGELTFYQAKGCSECHGGFKGRLGIYEVLIMSEKIEQLAVKKMPAVEIRAQAIKEGMVSMEQDGLVKALDGVTTLEEILRVTKAE